MQLLIGDNPIIDFTTEGYFSCIFSTLFPTGTVDYLALCQDHVTIGNCFKHFTMYDDSRFARQPPFHFFCSQHQDAMECTINFFPYVRQHLVSLKCFCKSFMTRLEGKEVISLIMYCIFTSLRVLGNKYWFHQCAQFS